MPLYEYQCNQCNQVIEIMQKFSDEPLTKCPNCGGAVHKLMSLTSFALKGSGWYTTDYKRASSGSSKSGAKNNDSGSAASCGTGGPCGAGVCATE